MLGEVQIPWGETWTLTCRLARVGSRTELVGITLESDPPAPVTTELWRSLPLGRIAEQARLQLVRDGIDPAEMYGPPAPHVSGELTRAVAALYSPSTRKPSKTVAEQLRADGWEVTDNAVRGAIHRARKRGLIPERTQDHGE